MPRRGYVLTSVWRLAAPVARCWDVLADPGLTWPSWWPGLTATEVRPSRDGLVGSSAMLTFRSSLGYGLRVRLVVTGAQVARWVRVHADGDLTGSGLVRLDAPTPSSTRIRVTWDVTTTRAWMNATAPVLRPVFVASHAAVMRSGEHGLARRLGASPPSDLVADARPPAARRGGSWLAARRG